MSDPGSVSHWIACLKDGDPAAAQPLWERYYRRLVALARKKLQAARRRAADEEDVVQNAFHSFFRALAQGRFPQLDDRDSLWRLLVVITANKALKQLTHEGRRKRGGGIDRALEDAAWGPLIASRASLVLAHVPSARTARTPVRRAPRLSRRPSMPSRPDPGARRVRGPSGEDRSGSPAS